MLLDIPWNTFDPKYCLRNYVDAERTNVNYNILSHKIVYKNNGLVANVRGDPFEIFRAKYFNGFIHENISETVHLKFFKSYPCKLCSNECNIDSTFLYIHFLFGVV